MEDRSSFSKPR